MKISWQLYDNSCSVIYRADSKRAGCLQNVEWEGWKKCFPESGKGNL